MVPWRLSLHIALVAGGLFLTFPALAQSPTPVGACEPWVARLVAYQGTLSGRRASGVPLASVSLNDTFCVGDVLEIGPFSRAAVQLPDQTVVRLDQGTIASFAAPQDDKRTWLDILKGAIHVISRDPRALRVITPFANAGIEGTEFLVQVGADSATVLVFEGRVKVQNTIGAATANGGESVLARAGSAPVLQQVVRPRDQVVWTLYYPPTGSGPLPDADASPTLAPRADFFVGRAEQRLAVGRVTEAEADLAEALKLAPGSAEVLARQSVIALTRNDAATAAPLADRAVATDPGSVSARLGQSYARQSVADLPGAVATLEVAADQHPDNALVRARLAELYLASGDVDRSEASARAAVAADPKLGLAQSILGFAKLTRVQLGEARAAFNAAILLEPNAPLPRLGLGLAKIRDGDLAAGRAEIETAVILDPNNSLVRSYVGKAYYEEKRTGLAASQLGIAKELDPNDPTPWFYDAIRKQTVNRPIEALEDLQASIARNDNRAVYRSRLELDQDLASRSASQGRIYRDLGFDELALRSGWESVAESPADFSGHRLLADSYAALTRHEIARVNELLQSQLLQPLNMTPVQPQLGDANLFILDSAGPSGVAFNEFNPLFSQNGLTFQGSLVAGGNDTRGEDLVIAGLHDRLSFSLGQFHFETDGFRDNNDLDQDVFNGLVQYQFSPETSVLAEVRHTEREQGDLALLFDPANYLAELRQEEKSTSGKLGFRHALSPRSTILLLANAQAADNLATLAPFFVNDQDIRSYGGEAQFIHQADRWQLVTGLRYNAQDLDETLTLAFPIDDPPFLIEDTTVSNFDTDYLNAYAYGTTAVTGELTVTVGAGAIWQDGQLFSKDRVTPKLGLTWQPTASTTFRAAYFSTLEGNSFSRQDIAPSLEPTPVAGFNQFFAGLEGEEAERIGAGLDHRFSEELAGGIEYSVRDLEEPYLALPEFPEDPILEEEADVREYAGRAYLYYAPAESWGNLTRALTLEYQYDRARNEAEFTPLSYLRIETHRVPVQVRFFHTSGLAFGAGATWVDQDGLFQAPPTGPDPFTPPANAGDSFVTFDAFVGYRLPGRRGVLRIEARNLLGNEFQFQDVDPENPRIYPERVVLAKLTVAFD